MSAEEAQNLKLYTQDEIQQILNLAIAQQAYQGEFTREQLVEIAEELEITSECLQLAEKDWLNQQLELQKREAFNSYRQGQLQHSAGRFAIINSSLVTLNFLIAGHLTWSLYIILFWGVKVALNAWKTYNTQGESYEQAYQKWKRKHQLKEGMSNLLRRLQQAWEA